MLTVKELRKWLSENCSHIQLIEYGGLVKAKSKFINTDLDYEFWSSFNNIKSAIKRGRHVGLSPEARNKFRENNSLAKFGVTHPKKSEEVQTKYRITCMKNYGAMNYLASDIWKASAKDVYRKALGVDNPAKSPQVKEKIKHTNLERYGHPTYAQSTAMSIEGGTVKDICNRSGLSKCSVYSLLRAGIKPAEISRGNRSTEMLMREALTDLKIKFVEDRKCEAGIRPDFYLPDHKIALECDGLYWHSDAVISSREHHRSRKSLYMKHGIVSLFFREDELLHKFPIVLSIVRNKLSLSTRIFARKTELVHVSKKEAKEFLEANHLMGPGQGRAYGLSYKGSLVFVMQVKGGESIEISRVCSSLNTRVVGGFTKLLSYVKKSEHPKSIKTFIDLRYGDGSYLQGLGFTKMTEYVSFKWTKGTQSVHRSKFPNSTGYDQGYHRIWDCGQAKWVMNAE